MAIEHKKIIKGDKKMNTTKKKKSIVTFLAAFVLLIFSVTMFTACGKNNNNHDHTHTYATEWSKDETNHWHAATCEHKTEKKDVAVHTWNSGEITTSATEETEGVKTFTCTVCKQTKTETIPATGHTHTYATEWSKDETNHWHAATCEHKTEKKDVAAHVYDDENDASCNVCGYERVAKENGITFNISARTYDKTEQGLTTNEYSIKGGTVSSVEYKVKGAEDTEYSLTAPVNAGEYTVRIKVTGNAEYMDIESTIDFVIAKRELFYGQVFRAADRDYTKGHISRSGRTYYNGSSFNNSNMIAGDEIYITVTFEANEVGAKLVSCELSGKDADNYFLSNTVKPYLN